MRNSKSWKFQIPAGKNLVNCKERTTCTNSRGVTPDLWEDQDQ